VPAGVHRSRVPIVDIVEGLRDAARRARECPVEYSSGEEPGEPEPFGLNVVSRRLAALGREPT
jgi:hypothetical protein